MFRTLSKLLLVGLILAGCTRSADPLDWKIEGRHLDDLQESLDGIIASLPKDLSKEFLFCFNNVKADTLIDRSGALKDQEDRVCRRLRDKSVREILIEGNELARQEISRRLASESEFLLRLINQSDQLTEAQRQALPARIDHTQAGIDHLKEALAKSDRRLAELRPPAAAP